jgi:hypothetical protein
MKLNNRIFSWGIIFITCPLLPGAGLIGEKERIALAALSALLFIFHLTGSREMLRFTVFLSLFISIFLGSRFIFLDKIDLFPFQAAMLILFFFRKRDWEFTDFSIAAISLVIVTFLLQFLINRFFLGFYLNFWIDLKRTFPVFLFCMTYFIVYSRTGAFAAGVRMTPWVRYFIGLFVFSVVLSFLNFGERKGFAAKKIEHNLAFFYKDREKWKDMSSSFRRGLVYKYLGLWPKARNEFKKILILSPEDKDAHFNLAQSYQAEKFWYEAMLEYEKVVEMDPLYRGSRYGLAVTYKAFGETGKAEEEFLKEIKINPEGIRAYLALEELYEKQGLIKKINKIRAERLKKITVSIGKDDINDEILKIMPVVLNGGAVTVEVVARGTFAQGFWPRMEVWLSQAGRLVRGKDVWVKSDTWKSYYFHFKTLPGEEKLIVHFTNDFFGGVENDRNLYIKKINFIYGR